MTSINLFSSFSIVRLLHINKFNMKEKEKKVVKAVGCWIILRNIMMWVNILFSLSVIGLGIYIMIFFFN